MIPWWLVALLVAESRPKVSNDRELQRKIEVVSARLTKRAAYLASLRLTVLEQQRVDESGRLPPRISKVRAKLIEDYELLQKLMAQQYRRAGGEQRLERR